ncbi:hypothetical protein [Nocardioides daejeonensis]|uniref:hypothetical protein n=1 Tax=Nocardioides daejeonensis TaxID=1046556 RepID=UPI000D746FF8|nr:hypothetical protein [Nocardioides daejeonensis]
MPDEAPYDEKHLEHAPGQATTYEQFGRDFFRVAVTEQRILAGVDVLAGEPIAFGPIGVGPGRLARVRATGVIERPTATSVDGDLVRLIVTLPVSLSFELDLQLEKQRFDARLSIPLELTARALTGCRVFIDVLPPRGDQIEVDLRGFGLRASLLQRVAGVEAELTRFVAKYVARELEKPAVRAARLIDVAHAIDRAWSGVDVT